MDFLAPSLEYITCTLNKKDMSVGVYFILECLNVNLIKFDRPLLRDMH
jgi:hypothetical protein